MYRFKLYHEKVGSYELKHAPKGWDTLELNLTRDRKLHGMTMDYTAELVFVKDGFDFIHSIYEAYGIEQNIVIQIYEAERQNFPYQLIYTGTIALEKWVAEDFPRQGKTNIDLAGFHHKFLNAEDTEVNMQATTGIAGNAMMPLNTVGVTMHSQGITQGFDALNEIEDATTAWMNEPTGDMLWDDAAAQIVTFGFDKIIANDLEAFQYGTGFLEYDADAPLFTSKVNATLELSFDLKGALRVSNDKQGDQARGDFDDVYFDILFRKNNEPAVSFFTYHKSGIQETHQFNYSAQNTVTVEVKPGDKIYLQGVMKIRNITSPAFGRWSFKAETFFYKDSTLKIGGTTTTSATDSAGVMVHEAFARIVESVTGHQDSFYSDYFGRTDSTPRRYLADGKGSKMILVNGFGLRGFPQDYDQSITEADKLKRYMHLSFKDLFANMDSIGCLGVGIEKINGMDMVRVEERSHFYRNNEVAAHLGVVSELKKSVGEEYYFKEATFGYKDWKVEEQNGLQEFNAKQTWTLPITRVKNKYEEVCDFIAAGYRIEKTRRERYVDADTKDTQDDDKTFVITLERDGFGWRTATNEGVSSTQGIEKPDAVYNLRISPRNMLNNHSAELSASLYKMEKGLQFLKGEGNYKMGYTVVEGAVSNGQDVWKMDLKPAYFIPEEYEFECPVTQFQARAIRDNPYALIKFMDSGHNELQGFLLEMKYKAREKTGTFKLLRAV